jgi:mRNA degradation ribonuclease J1/J2
MAAVKKAADATGRKICFIGMSLGFYLEAAAREGRAPFDPKEVITAADMDDYDPNELLIVTTGSQVGAGWLAGSLAVLGGGSRSENSRGKGSRQPNGC